MKVLLLVDIQVGFCTGGNLAVPHGEAVVPVANQLIADGGYDLIAASQDWHPSDHGSFASQHPGKKPFEMGELAGKPQMMWPDHCVQNTADAAFHPELAVASIDYIQQKGEDRAIDSYSAFRDNGQDALTGLSSYLIECGATQLDVCGLATDYCVKASAIDAVSMLPGVKVRFIEDASRGIDPAGVAAAEAEMQAAGIAIVSSRDVLREAAG